jgi:hypothetical protein
MTTTKTTWVRIDGKDYLVSYIIEGSNEFTITSVSRNKREYFRMLTYDAFTNIINQIKQSLK